MNKIVLIFAIILVLGGAILYGYLKTPDQGSLNNNLGIRGPGIPADETSKGPIIEVTPSSYDLGTVIYGEVAEHTFVVKNLGSQPLEILRLSTSCGCTKATIAEEDKVIAPGQSVDMLVTFDPAVHKDDMDLGDITRVVYIRTNDPKNPETEVEITAKVIKTN